MATNKKASKGKAPVKAPAKKAVKPSGFTRAKNFISNIISEVKKDRDARKKAATAKQPVAKKATPVKSKASAPVKGKTVAAKKNANPVGAKKAAPSKSETTKKVGKKAAPAKGTKATAPKTQKPSTPVKKSTGQVAAKKKQAAPQKQQSKQVSKPEIKQSATPEVIHHGTDLHLIPVTGEINPAGTHDSKIHEQAYRKHSDTLMNQENMRAKAALATRKHAKAVFRNFRQS
ncbi:MAG: hypothetical protein KA149_01105 [Chitinophagales bacterium]|nr:hypothetical protein [Chitinophagales bacterium]